MVPAHGDRQNEDKGVPGTRGEREGRGRGCHGRQGGDRLQGEGPGGPVQGGGLRMCAGVGLSFQLSCPRTFSGLQATKASHVSHGGS